MADIAHRIGIRAPADAVYAAIATREGVAGWWSEDTTGDSLEGGSLRVRFTKDGIGIGDMTMKIVSLSPGSLVLWEVISGPEEWIGTHIRFDLAQADDQCIVLFGHNGWAERIEFMQHCSMKWATFLLSLRQLVETGTGRPSPRDLKIDNWN
jgi:uncharacterized protein YndB with AHSA1/START domain